MTRSSFRRRSPLQSTPLVLVSALLLRANDILVTAFQSNVPTTSKSLMGRVTAHEMAASSYQLAGKREYSFLGPLFQEQDLSFRFQNNRGQRVPSSPVIFSSSFSFLDESNLYDDEDLLKYLPTSKNLTPKTRKLLQRVTSQYVNGGEPLVQLDEVMQVIDEEYKSIDVPMTVGNLTFDFTTSGEIEDSDAAQILAFAAYHRLPRDVALLLFGPLDKQDGVLQSCRQEFAKTGWRGVQFPNGLGLQAKRKFLRSKKQRYMPVPRVWVTSRKDAARKARVAIDEASYVQAPPRRLLSREEFLATMDEELSSPAPSDVLPSVFRDALLFFPRQNRKLQRLRKVASKKATLAQRAGLAGVTSYLAINFAWYCYGIFCYWRDIAVTMEIPSGALIRASWTCGKIGFALYIGTLLVKLFRFQKAQMLAPFGSGSLRVDERTQQNPVVKLFAVLAGTTVGTFLSLWSINLLGEAVLLRILGTLAI